MAARKTEPIPERRELIGTIAIEINGIVEGVVCSPKHQSVTTAHTIIARTLWRDSGSGQ